MHESDFSTLPLHLTEFNLTLSDRSYINDSLARAPFLINTLIQNYDRLSFMGIWNARDSYVDFSDSARYLFGGSGILTKTGAGKPAFYALYFLHRLYSHTVTSQDGCLITANDHGHFKLLAHNMTGIKTAYYLKEEYQISALEIDQMSDTTDKKTLHIRIEGLADGDWQIRKYSLHQRAGSILNEWLNLGMESGLRREELQYLERICSPRLFIQSQHAERGILEFDTELEPNEVQYLHVTELN